MRLIFAACALAFLVGCNNAAPTPKANRSVKSSDATTHVGTLTKPSAEACEKDQSKLRKSNCPNGSSSSKKSGENCPNGGSNCPPSSGDGSWDDEDSGDENCPNGGSNCPPSSGDDSWDDEDSGDENCPNGGSNCPPSSGDDEDSWDDEGCPMGGGGCP